MSKIDYSKIPYKEKRSTGDMRLLIFLDWSLCIIMKRRKIMVQIDMQKPDHCLRCPLLNDDDMCCLQDYEGQEEKWDWTWEQQMQNCPLKEVDSPNRTEEEA